MLHQSYDLSNRVFELFDWWMERGAWKLLLKLLHQFHTILPPNNLALLALRVGFRLTH